jgi:electron transfer flavoprotein beta subunit
MRTGDSVVKVIVCVKQVPDMTEAKMDREAKTIIREGVSSIINPYDIHAVEEGLRIREKKGGSVIALSMGIPSVVEMLKQIIAMGVDEGVLLTDKAFAGSDTLATSYTLSKAIEKINDFDIILCGKQTVDGDTAQVGPGLAEKLGIPHITNVVDIREIEENYIECKRTVENGWEVIKLPIPAVITVEKDINIPRFPNIKGIRNMKNPKIEIWNAENINIEYKHIGLKGSPTQVVKTFIPKSKVAAETIEGPTNNQVKKLISILNELHITVNTLTEEVTHIQ